MDYLKNFSIVIVSNVVKLDLSSNRLEGPIPDSFLQLQSLESTAFWKLNLFNGTFRNNNCLELLGRYLVGFGQVWCDINHERARGKASQDLSLLDYGA